MSKLLVEKLNEMISVAKSSEKKACNIANTLDYLLDDYGADDGFGTEKECDPRGDFRNGEFTVFAPEDYTGEDTVAGCVQFVIEKIKSVIDEDEYFAEYLSESLED